MPNFASAAKAPPSTTSLRARRRAVDDRGRTRQSAPACAARGARADSIESAGGAGASGRGREKFLRPLQVVAALEILKHLTPRDVARVAATRTKERDMLVGCASEIAETAWGRVKLRKGDARAAWHRLLHAARETLKELDGRCRCEG